MPLTSEEVKTLTSEALTEASKIPEAAPALSNADMLSFKASMSTALDGFTTLPDSVSSLSSTLSNLDPASLGSSLTDMGFTGGDISSFDFSLDSLGDISTSIDSFATKTLGGVSELLNAKRSTFDISETSMEGVDLTKQLEGFVGGIGRSIKNVIENANKTAQELANELEQTAKGLEADAAFSFGLEKAEELASAFQNSFESSLSSIKSNIPDAEELDKISKATGESLKKDAEVAAKLLNKKIDNLENDVPTMTPSVAGKLKGPLSQLISSADQLTSKENLAQMRSQGISMAKIFNQFNATAAGDQVANVLKSKTIDANEEMQNKLKLIQDDNKERMKDLPGLANLLGSVGNSVSINSAANGRVVADKTSIVELDKKVTNVTVFNYQYWYPTAAFGRENAEKINNLNRKVRKRFADCIKDFNSEKIVGAYGCEIVADSTLQGIDYRLPKFLAYVEKHRDPEPDSGIPQKSLETIESEYYEKYRARNPKEWWACYGVEMSIRIELRPDPKLREELEKASNNDRRNALIKKYLDAIPAIFAKHDITFETWGFSANRCYPTELGSKPTAEQIAEILSKDGEDGEDVSYQIDIGVLERYLK